MRHVGGEGPRGGGRRGDPGAHHRKRDDEGDEVDAERLVGVERGARGLRIFGDEFEIAERGDQRHDEGDEERQPDDAADLVGDLTGERIDAGAENVADDEQQQQPRTHDPVQARLGLSGRCSGIQGEIGHRAAPSTDFAPTLLSAKPMQAVATCACVWRHCQHTAYWLSRRRQDLFAVTIDLRCGKRVRVRNGTRTAHVSEQ